MEIVNKQAGNIITNLLDLVSQTEELKIERGLSPRSVRQWKKDIKSKYAALVNDNERLRKCLGDREKENYAKERRFEAEPTDRRRLYELHDYILLLFDYTNYAKDNSGMSESGGRKNSKENYGWQRRH